jgi:hypothetical protein
LKKGDLRGFPRCRLIKSPLTPLYERGGNYLKISSKMRKNAKREMQITEFKTGNFFSLIIFVVVQNRRLLPPD